MQSQHAKSNEVVAADDSIEEDENDKNHIPHLGFDGLRNCKGKVYHRC